MSLATGATFAGYTIQKILGFGGMGEVYLARHSTLPREVALKVLPAAASADHGLRQRFTAETPTVTTLYHPNIVEVADRGESDGQLWVAMDYVNGISVAQLVADQYPAGMPAGEALTVVAAVAGALDYAHRRGIVHRGVKPTNIVLSDPRDGEQRILLTDFGLARYSGQHRETAAYAAPEQLTGQSIDGRADQYGLAATAYYLFTGGPPPHLGFAPPKLSDRRPDLARLDNVLATAMANNPADRFGRCSEFAAALSERAGGWLGDRSPEAAFTVVDYPDDPEPETAAATAPPSSKRMRRWGLLGSAVGAALLLLVTGLLAGIMIGRKHDASPPQADGPSLPQAPAAIPTSSAPALPPAGRQLDGTYQVDVNRAQQTFNDRPDPQPPNVTTWWAFHSSCTPTGCVATGIQLDDQDHQSPHQSAGLRPLVFDFRDGAWQSRPETLQFPCVGPNGAADKQTMTQVLSLEPQSHGPLRGVMTVTVQTDECGQQGGHIVIPAVAGRLGAVPPAVTVPGVPPVAESPTPSPSSPPPPANPTPPTPGR
ncbi:hypothetical protein A5707_06580 [Mycobacterium kyorinense]|uniref:non-specific serine/threonine protein kinase n=1 Tax=Mycobacterium kyorinense TaxID=487514 RepID=A0A1A2YY03_9MYCO|nr:serine/threonine-protein kinase [Mycobacterium kyorinense]OBI42278.1 hypothetical protein A5707_06580 [Mycobacterium kyorinense]